VDRDDQETKKLNAIVGSAIKALAESGVDDEIVGAFAASHRSKVSTILGINKQPVHETDIADLVAKAVNAAVAAALEHAGMVNIKNAGDQTSRRAQKPASKRINVDIAGKRTSLSIKQSILDDMKSVSGGEKQALTAIQDLAESAPANSENRSAWVQERLLAMISMTTNKEQFTARH
jgi:hypothetical protein